MSTANVPAIHALLKVKFQAKPSPQQVRVPVLGFSHLTSAAAAWY